ncbi:hypothetical protein [Glycomyces tenuis]|uniref:hypothetical protein n=1 Tax=Glycomyces tenuis TaxID=58116 RepID=UPI0003FFFDE7|nr:hypothetical protein [Glycomyces tenuis]
MRIAITGHRDVHGATMVDVDTALRMLLAEFEDGESTVGITCLDDGVDQTFARAVLDLGGAIEVIVPAADYRKSLDEGNILEYDRLLALASGVRELDHRESTPEARMAAALAMLETADHVLAVWDGGPAQVAGGTADVVEAAKDRGLPVTVVWPDSGRRG